ncbi:MULTISPECIES: hypothetical protein [Rhizobium]|nr:MULTISPECIES: hypothetical protein [Rhizobium]
MKNGVAPFPTKLVAVNPPFPLASWAIATQDIPLRQIVDSHP